MSNLKGFIINGQTVKYNYPDLDNKPAPSGGGGVSEDLKTALLQLASKVAYIDTDGEDCYQDLYDALYSEPTYSVTNSLTDVTNSNAATAIIQGSQYVATLTPASGYTINSVQVTMGGIDVTGTVYSSGFISIASVTGNLVITAVATERTASLTSIDAVFAQGSAVIYDTDSLDTLKQYLVVVATWSDTSTSTVPSTDYTLSGTLTSGTATITVTYSDKTDTFSVTVTAWDIEWDYTEGSPLNNGFAHSTAVTGTMLNNGYQLGPVTSGSSGCTLVHNPDMEYANGVVELVFTITQMAVITGADNGATIFFPKARLRMYNNEITFEASSTNTIDDRIKIADISANTQYTLRFAYNGTSGIEVWLNGDEIYTYSGTLNANTTRLLLGATILSGAQPTPPTIVYHAIRCKEVT